MHTGTDTENSQLFISQMWHESPCPCDGTSSVGGPTGKFCMHTNTTNKGAGTVNMCGKIMVVFICTHTGHAGSRAQGDEEMR